MEIGWVQQRINANEYLITLHADQERRNDRLDIANLEAALLAGEIIEQYPDDPRGESCLVHGRVNAEDVMLFVVAMRRAGLLLSRYICPGR